MGRSVALARGEFQPPVQAELNPVAWMAGSELPYEEWLRHGSRLGLAGRSAGWWVGDWLRYGTARYGSKYTAASRVTGYDRQTLMNMVYIGSRFEVSRRRENLSWSHHAELAALEVEEQEQWLNRASFERLSVRDLREELVGRHASVRPGPATRQRSVSTSARAAARLASRKVICPHCGEEFVA